MAVVDSKDRSLLTYGGKQHLMRATAIMGILNVTPDSFSDGGRWAAAEAAQAHAQEMIAGGATWIDIGGESTRPGAEPVAADEEVHRVEPVLRRLAAALPVDSDVGLSIDTSKAVVAAAALAAGACMVNDVTAGGDPEMFAVVADRRAALVLMHMQGDPRTMQADPRYDDVVDDVSAFLEERMQAAASAGVAEDAIMLDPGIGFGKTLAHNRALIQGLPRISERLARPLLLGLSRKSFLTRALGRDLDVPERDRASHVIHALTAPHCAVLRVHDVPGCRDALRLQSWLRSGATDAVV